MAEIICPKQQTGDSIPPSPVPAKTALSQPFIQSPSDPPPSIHNLPTKPIANPVSAPSTSPPVRADECPHCGDLFVITSPEASFCPWCHVWLCCHHCCDRHSRGCDGNAAHSVEAVSTPPAVIGVLASDLGDLNYRLGTIYVSNQICQSIIRDLLAQLAKYEGEK